MYFGYLGDKKFPKFFTPTKRGNTFDKELLLLPLVRPDDHTIDNGLESIKMCRRDQVLTRTPYSAKITAERGSHP